ncbi:AP-1 complex subunit gamma-1 [Paramicrosporidium saccamoebae]|uniref:AP-1 complex subunit gamma-1 n=1 Tax=Paramicrosporidium saccamoebae TaxID=1246581 RepID=A0A2H9TIV4_9FUNG|nr:AP-1 complex subunit gamma-1 [Paramicrosporidium saccamoebae]
MGRDTLTSASARLQSNVVKAFTGYYRLKDFIHAIRACKTLAEERKLVAKESASIRTSFKEDTSSEQRYHAVAKLLFIYMLGYPAHFGQVESLKMVASTRLTEKRLGYLGSTQLLDEQQPTLTLITNSIKSDLNNSSPSIVALGLANLAATASPDIARDLADEVERLLVKSSSYIKKKAAFCASRLISRVPELAEHFEDKIPALLADRNHGVVLGGISLALQQCHVDQEVISRFRGLLVHPLIRQLQAIISGNFSAEYDVSGICDPFLQVRILRLLRLLGTGHVETSEAMSDILTQIATSTDPGKNVGHSVLYETAVTIMNIESDQALRTMAINILGRLLSTNTTDNNLRYVALALLNKIICAGSEGLSAVQRHRATILECLHDPDISIRRRAVDLALALISKDTIRNIVGELLQVLRDMKGTDELEFKQNLVTKLAIASAQYAPSGKWYVDTMVTVLCNIDDSNSLGLSVSILSEEAIAGRKEEIISTFVRIVNNTSDLHRYATEKLFRTAVLKELDETDENGVPPVITEALIQAVVWTSGEFADILLSARLTTDNQLVTLLSDWSSPSNGFSAAMIGYIITALGKLANRLSPNVTSIIAGVLETIAIDYVNSHDLHYRALEMKAISGDAALRGLVLARIPPDASGDQLGNVASASKLISSRPQSASRTDGSVSNATSAVGTPKLNPVMDVFAELATLSLDGANTPATAGASPVPRGVSAFSKDGVSVYFGITGEDVSGTLLGAEISNSGDDTLYDVLLQAAVPKYMKVHLDPASDATVMAGGSPRSFYTIITMNAELEQLRISRLIQIESSMPGVRLNSAFVGSIPEGVTDEVMERLLQCCGPVNRWKRVLDGANMPKSFGFCEFGSADAMNRALTLLHDLPMVGTKKLVVKVDETTLAYLKRYEEALVKDHLDMTSKEADIRTCQNLCVILKEKSFYSALEATERRLVLLTAEAPEEGEAIEEEERQPKKHYDTRRDEDPPRGRRESVPSDGAKKAFLEREGRWEAREAQMQQRHKRNELAERERKDAARNELEYATKYLSSFDDFEWMITALDKLTGIDRDSKTSGRMPDFYANRELWKSRRFREQEREEELDRRDEERERRQLEQNAMERERRLSEQNAMEREKRQSEQNASEREKRHRPTADQFITDAAPAAKRRKPLISKDYTMKELVAAGYSNSEAGEKLKQLYKEKVSRLIDIIPKSTEGLFALAVDWKYLEMDKLLPLIRKKTGELLQKHQRSVKEGESERISQSIAAQIQQHCEPETIVAWILEDGQLVDRRDSSSKQNDDATTFVAIIWRHLVFATESAAYNLIPPK